MKTNPSFRIFKLSTLAPLGIAVISASLLIIGSPARAGYIVTLQQVGSNVVATGSGAIDLTGLTLADTLAVPSKLEPHFGIILTGPTFVPSADLYVVVNGPLNFGSGSEREADSGSGDLVGISGIGGSLLVPHGYVSGAALSDSATYDNATFSSLGVKTGTFEWTWGTGANQNFTLQIGASRVPDIGSTFGLLFVSLLVLLGGTRLRHFRVA